VVTEEVEQEVGGSRSAAALGSLVDPDTGWTTAKVVVLLVATSLVAVMLALTAADRFGSRSADSVEVGFLQDMIHHHEQAVRLGVVGVERSVDPGVAHFALEAIIAQQYEIGYMEAILEEWGHGTGDIDRQAMVWMNMPTSLSNMPGMASEDEVRAYRDMTGPESDAQFLRLMTAHHRGGLHMAEYARDNADDERVVDLADRMARNQAAEVAEYSATAERLGITI
jgi:uncharacterized protein (DUF305 family)